MPSLLDQEEQATSIKMMLIGDAGSGKTGALASLATMGYTLHIMDFDNGTEILLEVFKDQLAKGTITEEQYKRTLDRVLVEPFFDKTKLVGQKIQAIGMPTAYTKAMKTLNDWPEYGPITELDSSHILVIDSTTMLSEAAFRLAWGMNPTCKNQLQIYGKAQEMVQKTMEMLYSPEIKCHVIFLTHVTYIEVSDGFQKGYPMTIGQALSLKVSRYFNVILGCSVMGSGLSAKRYINTKPLGNIDLKCPVLSGLDARLPQDSGLADYFKAKLGQQEL